MGRKMAQQERFHLTLQSTAIKYTYNIIVMNHRLSLLAACRRVNIIGILP